MEIQFPGFFDIQVNGFAGVDFNRPSNPEDIETAVKAIRKTGVTAFLPTLITSTTEHFARCARVLLDNWAEEFAGIHMEGPWISAEDGPRGAHNKAAVCAASIDDFKRRQDSAQGRIILVTLAPEVPGAIQMIEYLAGIDIKVAIGHSQAAPGMIRDAVQAGASLSTHLGNGCAGQLPRHPNLLWEQLANDQLFASLIVDGHHLPPATVKTFVRAKSPERALLITDAIAAAGCPPGRYLLGEVEVELDANGRVSPPGKPWLAGSALTMPVAVSNTVSFTGLPLMEVLKMATENPAHYLGMTARGCVTAEWDEVAQNLEIRNVA